MFEDISKQVRIKEAKALLEKAKKEKAPILAKRIYRMINEELVTMEEIGTTQRQLDRILFSKIKPKLE